MRIPFDHGTPKGLARAFANHIVLTALGCGWDTLSNGALLGAAEAAGVDVLLTTDQGIRYQQNLTGRRIALVVLTGTTKWTRIQLFFAPIVAAVEAAIPGSYTEVAISIR